MNRKKFLTTAGTLAAVYAANASMPAFLSLASTNDIKVGLIGVNGMGWANLNSLLGVSGVTCTALCDVDERILNKRAQELKDKGITVRLYRKHEELLADKDVNAVIIATPDHWHCLQLADACAAGKPVYIEKPLGNSIKECEAMIKLAEKYKTVVQVGQWQRSQQHFKNAIDFVHSGKLGKVRLVKAWAYQGWMKSIPVKPDTAVPQEVDYNRWLGPAVRKPFNENRFHFEFRWFWDYAGGLMTDWGVHLLDFALMGMKESHPKSIMATGGKFAYPDDAAETPDTLTTVYEFNDYTIQWEQATGINGGPYNRDHGIAFIGNNGTLVLNRSGWEVIPEGDRMEAVAFRKATDNGLNEHMKNFVEAIRKKDPQILNAPVTAGANVAIFSQMGNIAYRTGEKIYWNKDSRKFTSTKANSLLSASYNNGYKIPLV